MAKPGTGAITHKGKRYAFANGKWTGPDADTVKILNTLFNPGTCPGASSAVMPAGFACIKAAAKWAKDNSPDLPRFAGDDKPGTIH